jgi:integrase
MPSSVATDMRKIKALIRWMYKQKNIDNDWASLIKLPIIPKAELNLPTAEKAREIIIAGTTQIKRNRHFKINLEGRDCLLFMLYTGIRVNEALKLEASDFCLANEGHETFKVISKGKGGAKESLPLLPQALEILKRPRVGRHGKYFGITEEALNAMLSRGCRKLGITKITCHKLRHIFATENARGGMRPYVLKRLMRHSEITTTDEYYINLEMDDLKNELERCFPLSVKERTSEQTFRLIKNAIEQLKISDNQYKITTIEGDSIKIEKI